MQEARASWNTIYLDTEGFECQVTLRDEDEIALTERATVLVSGILESGGVPVVRRGRSESSSSEASTKDSSDNGSRSVDGEEKTYVDDKGLRRCNLPLRNGRRCSQPVTEREGRYGLFWSCPRYKDHAQRQQTDTRAASQNRAIREDVEPQASALLPIHFPKRRETCQ